MPVIQETAVLRKVQLPGGQIYVLVDANARAMLALDFVNTTNYSSGDYVVYNGDFYRATATHSGAWNANDFEKVTIGEELQRLEAAIAGGIHYVGKTSTALYDGDTTHSSIEIGGASHTAEAGDLTIVNVPNIAGAYHTATAYAAHTYLKNNNLYYITNAAITASENTSWTAVEEKMELVKSNPEFLYDGSSWSSFGTAEGFGDLAFKDSVTSETFPIPTGAGTVSVPVITENGGSLVTISITGVAGTTTVSSVSTTGSPVEVAKAGTAVRYGTADVSITGKVYGTANVGSQFTYGNANVGTTVSNVALSDGSTASYINYGTADVGEPVTVATRGSAYTYGTADVGDEVTYGNANVGTTYSTVAEMATDDSSFTVSGVTVSVPAATPDCLTFTDASTSSIRGVKTTALTITSAATSNTKLTPAKAASGHTAYAVGTTTISPATTAPTARVARIVTSVTGVAPASLSDTKAYGATPAPSGQMIFEAVAAPNSQTIVPAVSNGSIPVMVVTPVTVATANPTPTTVANGSITTGSQILTGLTIGSTAATVTVGTTATTIKSR